MAEWAGVVASTTTEYLKVKTVETMRKRRLMAMLDERGRVSTGHSGKDFQWEVEYKQPPIQGYDDMDTTSFARTNYLKNAVLPWRGYRVPDMMSGKERLMNSGPPALVKRYAELLPRLMKTMEQNLGEHLYIDGNLAANSKFWHGLESFFGNSGAYSGGFIAAPSDTYAGLSTVLGNYGGSWSATTWPEGTGDPHYDFWSPLIVDYTDTAWTAATKTWPNTCLEALRYGILNVQKNMNTKDTQLDVVMLANGLYRPFLDKLQLEENLHISPSDGSSGLWKLGFRNVQNFDGVDITWEYGIPAAVGYGLPMDQVELMVLGGELFVSKGPDYNIADDSYRFAVQTYSNLKFQSTRHFVKWMSVT